MEKEKFGTIPSDMSGMTINERHRMENTTANFYSGESIDKKNILGIQVLLLPVVGQISKLWLPISAEGKYQFEGVDNSHIKEDIYFLAKDGEWYACCTKPIYFTDEKGVACYSVKLHDQCLIEVGNVGQKCKLYIEMATEKSLIHHNYQLYTNHEIKIGRLDKNDIIYRNKFVSREHAVLYRENGELFVRDCHSANGIWVNGKKVDNLALQIGDVISIFGLNIIIGAGFLSINSNAEGIQLNNYILRQIDLAHEAGFYGQVELKKDREELFNRLPRRRQVLEQREIKIESPPMPISGEQIPLMLRMGGSMVMSAGSMMMGNYTSMISSVMFPMLTSKYTEKQKQEYEKRRVEKYSEYLAIKTREINEEKTIEERVLNDSYPELDRVLTFVGNGKRLWERRNSDDDFLNIRVGYGNVPILAKYNYSEERFSLEEDPLEDKMYELARKKVLLENAPIMCSFLENFVCGISGTREQMIAMVNRILMQMVMSHSYDEVKIVFLVNGDELKQFEYVRYLPHLWDDQNEFRFLATSTADAFQISEYLKKEFGDELNNKQKLSEIVKNRPYYVVFALDKRIFDSMEVLKDVMQLDENRGVSVITAFENLPKECFSILSLDTLGDYEIINLKQHERENVRFRMDPYDEKHAMESMKRLSNTKLKVVSQAYNLPKMITFLEMFGVGKIEHLNASQRWKDNNPVKSLATPIGISPDGTLFMLDLHQKYHGPHGLIAGMTGSGKSEFIITYILSLAINYRPDEVAFLLIDYKGGGLTSAFEDPVRGIYLPHLMGTITNLDGAAINRSLISIQSEMRRRQQLFKDAKGVVDESTIDIYSYQKLYRAGKVKEPLPHLLIIADEFAEMKQQEPEFMESLISIARIGRSLGVHLILATQKPSGVVNEQIRSNTKFRVCLKVQDKSDSMDMLKRPEGAEIKDTGRFYLQVGYNELFALGQSAWTGADYTPQDEMVARKDESVLFIDTLGQSVHHEKPKIHKKSTGKSQLAEIVKYLSRVAESEGIKRKLLWSEPLPKMIDNQSVIPNSLKGELNVYLGEVDDPARQKQYSYIYDFMECKNILILGGSKTGKTSMVQNILLQLTERYSSNDVNYYILDYSSNLMRVFNKVPHCGAVLLEDDTADVKKLFEMIGQIAEERRQLFGKIEADNFKHAREMQKIPLILIVIDNLIGLTASKATDGIYYDLHSIMKKVSNFGIHFILTCSHLNEASSRIRQEIGVTFAFNAKDKYEFQDAIGCKVNYVPVSYPGRGLVNVNDDALEIQTAIFGAGMDHTQKIEYMKECLSKVKVSDFEIKAKHLPSLTQEETYEDFASEFEKGRIPLGYTLNTIKPIALPLKQLKTLAVYWGNPKGIIPIMDNLLMRAQYEQMNITVFSQKENSIFREVSEKHVENAYIQEMHIVDCDQDAIFNANKNMLMTMMAEKKYLQEYCEIHNLDMKDALQSKSFPHQVFGYMSSRIKPRLIIIENMGEFCEEANDEVIASMNGLSMVAPLYNTFIVHCYNPGDGDKVKEHAIRRVLSREEMVLLFGGCFDKQGIIDLQPQYTEVKKTIEYNKCLMKYRGSIYEMMMPCGHIETEMIDQDDASIF